MSLKSKGKRAYIRRTKGINTCEVGIGRTRVKEELRG